jgi:hypothetical protein
MSDTTGRHVVCGNPCVGVGRMDGCELHRMEQLYPYCLMPERTPLLGIPTGTAYDSS